MSLNIHLIVLFRYLISQGASKNALTDEGERPIDLVDPNDQVKRGGVMERKEGGAMT